MHVVNISRFSILSYMEYVIVSILLNIRRNRLAYCQYREPWSIDNIYIYIYIDLNVSLNWSARLTSIISLLMFVYAKKKKKSKHNINSIFSNSIRTNLIWKQKHSSRSDNYIAAGIFNINLIPRINLLTKKNANWKNFINRRQNPIESILYYILCEEKNRQHYRL